MSPADRMPVASWYSNGWNKAAGGLATVVTSQSARLRAFAAGAPPNPEPMSRRVGVGRPDWPWAFLRRAAGPLQVIVPSVASRTYGSAHSCRRHILSRLPPLGIERSRGAWDYAFSVDDAVETVPELEWVACANELNAAYAADG